MLVAVRFRTVLDQVSSVLQASVYMFVDPESGVPSMWVRGRPRHADHLAEALVPVMKRTRSCNQVEFLFSRRSPSSSAVSFFVQESLPACTDPFPPASCGQCFRPSLFGTCGSSGSMIETIRRSSARSTGNFSSRRVATAAPSLASRTSSAWHLEHGRSFSWSVPSFANLADPRPGSDAVRPSALVR